MLQFPLMTSPELHVALWLSTIGWMLALLAVTIAVEKPVRCEKTKGYVGLACRVSAFVAVVLLLIAFHGRRTEGHSGGTSPGGSAVEAQAPDALRPAPRAAAPRPPAEPSSTDRPDETEEAIDAFAKAFCGFTRILSSSGAGSQQPQHCAPPDDR